MILEVLMLVSFAASLAVVSGIAYDNHHAIHPPLWLQVMCLVVLLCPTLILATYIADK